VKPQLGDRSSPDVASAFDELLRGWRHRCMKNMCRPAGEKGGFVQQRVAKSATDESTEGEGVGLSAGIEELDLEEALAAARHAHELVEALPVDRAQALFVHVVPMIRLRRLAIQQHLESYGSATFRDTEHEMQVARMEA
jgi:hypothetical protein